MTIRHLSTGILTIAIWVGSAASQEDPNALNTLNDYRRYAALHNAQLRAKFEEFKAAVEAVPQAKALPDPRFEFRYFIEHIETKVGPQQQAYGFMQTFPWFGKIAARTDAAAAAAKAARKRYEAERLKLFYEVTAAYDEYAYLHRAIDLAEQNVELVKHFEQVARARFAAAAGSHPDVLQAQIELEVLRDQLARLQDMLEPRRAELNRILNRPGTAPLPPPQPLEYRPVAASRDDVLAAVRQANPILAALDQQIQAARHRADLAAKRGYPDLTLGIGWIDTGRSNAHIRDNGKDPVIATFSINLPIWIDSNNAHKRQAQAEARKARLERLQQENDLSARALNVLFELQDARRRIGLYRDGIIPKARQRLQVTEDSYRSGRVDFSTLVDAQRSLLAFELQYERAVTDHCRRLAELEMLTGRSLRP